MSGYLGTGPMLMAVTIGCLATGSFLLRAGPFGLSLVGKNTNTDMSSSKDIGLNPITETQSSS